MLTYEDCVGLTDLDEEEIEAIAQHEHVPEIVAAEMGCWLAHNPGGESTIEHIIEDDIEMAKSHGHPQEARHWKHVLDHFAANHHHALEREAA
ncbi:MAG: hypothetical protein WAV07_00140 [Candidatus Contendobacter sp.]